MDINSLNLSKSVQIPFLRHYYEKYLDDVGTFVEVGAYDGESWSNTSGLADLGWTGVYVEPIREYAELCAARHANNRVSVYNYAIGDGSDATVTIDIRQSISSTCPLTRAAHDQIPWARDVPSYGHRVVRSLSMDYFLRSINLAPGFQLLVVDIEGGEESLFRGFDINYWTPRMLIVELCDYSSSFGGFEELQKSAKKVRHHLWVSGYRQVYADEVNTIFVR